MARQNRTSAIHSRDLKDLTAAKSEWSKRLFPPPSKEAAPQEINNVSRAGAGARRQPSAYRERDGGRGRGKDQQWKAHWRLGGQVLCPAEISRGAGQQRPGAHLGHIGQATERKSRLFHCANAVACVISCAPRRPGAAGAPTSHPAPPAHSMQLGRQPGNHHAVRLIGPLLLARDMGGQRLDAYQRQPPLGAQPLHLQPPQRDRLARPSSPARTPSPWPAPPPSPALGPAETPSPAPSFAPAPAHHDQPPRSPACPRPGRSRSARHLAVQPAQPLPPGVPPPVPRVAPLPLLTGRSLCCDWDTKPELSRREDVPVSAASCRTDAFRVLSYYYAAQHQQSLASPGTELK